MAEIYHKKQIVSLEEIKEHFSGGRNRRYRYS